jgi:SNF2 family DNA or RNA helicase
MTLQLMAHQRAAASFLMDRAAGALLMDRGTGKTATMLSLLSVFPAGSLHLYVAPKSTLHSVEREAVKFGFNVRAVVLEGTRKKKLQILKEQAGFATNKPCPMIFLINYEAVRTMVPELSAIRWLSVTCDESTKIKDRRTQIGKAIKAVSLYSKHRYIMTGFPVTESVEDAWNQYDFLMRGAIVHHNFFAFRYRYCILGGYKQKEVVGYKNLEEFMEKIRPYSYVIRREQCLELPPKIYQTVETELSDKQKNVYRAAEDHVRYRFEQGEIHVKNALMETQKLMQISSGFVYREDGEDRATEFLGDEKISVIVELLEETPGKAVVFTNYTAEGDFVEKELRAKGFTLTRLLASDNPADRDKKQVDFADPKGPRIFLSDVRIGGVGLNLQEANMAIFHSLPFSLELRVQAEDRVHRKGSEKHSKVTIIDILAKDTIDESIYGALRDKRDLAEAIIDGVFRKGGGESGESRESGVKNIF